MNIQVLSQFKINNGTFIRARCLMISSLKRNKWNFIERFFLFHKVVHLLSLPAPASTEMRRNLVEGFTLYQWQLLSFFLSFSTRLISQHFTQSSASNTDVKRFLIGFAPTLQKMLNIINKLKVFLWATKQATKQWTLNLKQQQKWALRRPSQEPLRVVQLLVICPHLQNHWDLKYQR